MDTLRLRDLATLSAGANPRLLPTSGLAQKYPILSIRDVNQSLTDIDDLAKIAALPASVVRFQLKTDDVVVTTRGADVRAAVVGATHVGTVIGANLAIVRIHGQLAPVLLAAFLRQAVTREALMRDTAGAVTPGFTLKALGGLAIRVPSPERQRMLVEYLAAASAYREDLTRALELRELASSSLITSELSALEAR